MADWSSHNITLTTKGASALSKVQAGSGSLTITRVIASEQYVAESTLREVTSLSVENLPLTIIDRHEVQDGGSVIQVQLSNLYLGNAFTLNEIGVFATHSDNPSEEFLYIIAQVDADTGDKIPVYATTPVTATYDIYLYNVGADNVQITISSAGLVTYEALNKACDIIQRNTTYEVGDIMHSYSLKKGLAIKCTVGGTTKSTDTDLSHKEVGDTVEDGTSQWVVIAPTSTADFDAHNHSLDAHPELVAQILESGGVNVIKRSHEYAKGDIAYSNKIPSWAFLKCTVPGTTSDGWYFPEPSEIQVNATIVDGTVTWKVCKVGSGEGVWKYSETDNSIHPKDTDDLTPEDLDVEEETLKEIVASVVDEKLEYIPIGTVIPFSGNGAIPSGYLLCNGAAVGRSQYSKLFEVIGSTYGEGDGVSTFNLPDLTIQPPALTMRYIIKAFNGMTHDSALIDVTQFAQELANVSKGLRYYRQASKVYNVGDIAYHATLPTGWYLECTTEGITDAGALTITSPTIGGTVSDGTVVWTVRQSGHGLAGFLNSAIAALDNGSIRRLVEDDILWIVGGNNAALAPYIRLYGKDSSNPGAIQLIPQAGANNATIMHAKPNGALTWAGNDLAGSAIVAKSLGTNGYFKYASGLIVQWGSVDMTQQATTKTVNLPISFPNSGITGCAGSMDVNHASPCGVTVSNSSITIKTTTSSSWTNWFAIGY